jgi:two-component system, chemotaxis family, response regulator Rcp1
VFQILLAEDNPGDVLLFREALKSRNVPCELVVAEDGQEAITFLENAATPEAGSRLHLIVLDINLPKYNGDVVLQHVRRKPSFDRVPVIVLTSSPSPSDRAAALESGANLYLQKSSDLAQLLDIGRIIESILAHSAGAAPPRISGES